MKIKFDALSHVGMVRTNNEDCWIAQMIWNDSYLLCGAIDGMGGYEGGEVAAEIARKTIIDYVVQHEGIDNILKMLESAVVKANNAIVEHKREHLEVSSMGCVATVGIIDLKGNQLFLAHVGDTRLYQFHNWMLQKLTFDHSIVGHKEDMGELSEEEAMNDPERNIVTKSLGFEMLPEQGADYLDMGIFPLQPDSQLLFCSDGLFDMITSREISSILEQDISEQEKTKQLIDLANECGGKDNVTVVLVHLFPSESSKDDNTASAVSGKKEEATEGDNTASAAAGKKEEATEGGNTASAAAGKKEEATEGGNTSSEPSKTEEKQNKEEKDNNNNALPQERNGKRHVTMKKEAFALVVFLAFAIGVLAGYLLKAFLIIK
ncbi:MAG: protein phosphatase 2C domain-containing protein [Prevotella sp.]|nr:protein phosphatase 2C domain-containing protein [Prevotella sp.]